MEQTSEQKENEVIQNCDAIIFGSVRKEDNVHTTMLFFKTKNKIEPGELGHKFNIMLFDRPSPEDEHVEMFTAILGDPKGYVERMGKAGYHGLVIKKDACKKKEIKDVFRKILSTWGFEEKQIRKVIKATAG